MNLEGSLEAFSLPDIFQLLSFTKKTGALHIRRPQARGVLYFQAGALTGGSSDIARQSFARRLVGAGLVSDESLDRAIATATAAPGSGLGRALADAKAVDEGVLHEHLIEQTTDTVFDLLRATEGDFSFVVDEANPDDLGVTLVVDEVTTEGKRRLERWESLTRAVPTPDSVVSVVMSPGLDQTALTADEWALLALVDGRLTVAHLVSLTGRGEFATVSTLASLVDRGLVAVRAADEPDDAGVAALLRRQGALSRLEGVPDTLPPLPPVPPAPRGGGGGGLPEVTPSRPEPLLPRRPDFPDAGLSRPGGMTSGATALADNPEPIAGAAISTDPSVNKSLLLRLIAGVRGL